jgi:hypothetical protein
LLKALPRDGEFVFIGSRSGKSLHRKAMAEFLETMNVPAVVHGFRSSFKDWASESTAYPNEVSELALAHAIPNKVESAYRRGDLFEKRRRLMDDWAKFCLAPPPAGQIVPIRGAAQ